MKKFIIGTLAMLSLAGTLYAGSGCGGCTKDKEAETEKKEGSCSTDKA